MLQVKTIYSLTYCFIYYLIHFCPVTLTYLHIKASTYKSYVRINKLSRSEEFYSSDSLGSLAEMRFDACEMRFEEHEMRWDLTNTRWGWYTQHEIWLMQDEIWPTRDEIWSMRDEIWPMWAQIEAIIGQSGKVIKFPSLTFPQLFRFPDI